MLKMSKKRKKQNFRVVLSTLPQLLDHKVQAVAKLLVEMLEDQSFSQVSRWKAKPLLLPKSLQFFL